jgi:hypothetical protein
MTGGADVQSLEALIDWHAALCVFRTDALEALASVALEIQRADAWLDDRLRDWQREARDAEQEVVRYKAELANRKLPDFSGRIPDCSVQEENLRLAVRRLEHARERIETVRKWYQRLPKMIQEVYDGPARHLSNFLEAELPRGIALLKNRIGSLEAYLNVRGEAPPPPAASEEKA